MDIRKYLDSTYLKTAEQATISEEENTEIVKNCIHEALVYEFKLVMIRPEQVSLAKNMIVAANSKVAIGTVIDFPNGDSSIEAKLTEAQIAIKNGADELDFVIDYTAFKNEAYSKVKEEIIEGTTLALKNHKIIKWIIEVAALSNHQIVQITAFIKNTIISHFQEKDFDKVFIKSSTGFYKTPDGIANGATISSIMLMLENSVPLQVKAAGGIKSRKEAEELIQLGVKRIGTSAAKAIVLNENSNSNY